MIKRQISKQILKYLKQYPVISLTGPRQSGKTTLVKNIFPKMDYLNLEDIETRDFAMRDPKSFLGNHPKGLIIDEVQRIPELMSQIQVIVDEKKVPGQFILTGSQNFLLMEKVSQSLAGRTAILNLLPFSLLELEKANINLSGELEKILLKGFYPKLFDQKIEIKNYYSNYIQTYIERDVRTLKNIANLNTFKCFLDLCAGRCGQILNYFSLAQDCGIDQKTAKEWVSILEASFIIFLLRPHYKNFNKRVTKMPKLYFYDTGLACSLLNILNKKQLGDHYLKGGLFESFVISEFYKHKLNLAERPNYYFWRNKTGNEVDLIIEKADKSIPLEIKAGKTISQEYFKGLNYFNKLSGNNPKNSYVIYAGDQKQVGSSGNVFSWHSLPAELDRIDR